jgi:hypothetical protein
MADTFTATINADGSATVLVKFDITGTGLLANDAANSTEYDLPVPQPTTDASGNSVAAVPWTTTTAVAAIQSQAEAWKAQWVADQIGAGQ